MVEPTEATAHLRPTVVLGLVYASTSASWAAWALLAVILPFRFESLGLSVVQYGVAIAALALGMLLTESVWGALAFRIGKVRTIVALGAVVVVVYASIGFSTTFLPDGLPRTSRRAVHLPSPAPPMDGADRARPRH